MSTFNALDKSWILVRWKDGRVSEIGMRELFLCASEISELADSSPLVVTAQLRLLMATAYRVLNIDVRSKWKRLYKEGQFETALFDVYFDTWRDRFDLFGERPFLQTAGLITEKPAPLSKLAPELVSGNNATLFDHSGDDDETAYRPSDALKILLVGQGYGLGGLLKAKGTVDETPFSHPSATDSVTARGVALWLEGESLFETLMLNLVPQNQPVDDKPVWERDLTPAYFERKIPDGVMDRYTYLSRMIRLMPERDEGGETVVRRMYYTQGRAIDKTQFDPMQCYKQNAQTGIRPVLLSEGKATWRDLSALLQLDATQGIRAACLDFVGTLAHEGVVDRRKTLNLHIAGMSSDKAKVMLWRHDKVSLPAAFLQNEELVIVLTARLQNAEETAGLLWKRIRTLCWYFYAPVKDMMSPDTKNVSALAQQIDSRRTYWARLEGHLPELMKRIADAGENDTSVEKWWTQIADDAATEAQAAAVERLGPSPRAWRAAASIPRYFSNRRENN